MIHQTRSKKYPTEQSNPASKKEMPVTFLGIFPPSLLTNMASITGKQFSTEKPDKNNCTNISSNPPSFLAAFNVPMTRALKFTMATVPNNAKLGESTPK